jgi:penicillin-binding protein 2
MQTRELKRLVILGVLVLLVSIAYGRRLMQLQIVEGERYTALLQQGTSQTQVIKAARGEILDRSGNPLAQNLISYDIVFDKALSPPKDQNAVILALIKLFRSQNETWIDSLPLKISGDVLAFEGSEGEINRLISRNFLI